MGELRLNLALSTGLSVKLMKGQSDFTKVLANLPLVPETLRTQFLKMIADNEGQLAFIEQKFEQLMATFPIVPPLPPGGAGQPPAPGL